jgi:two-component system chemotaxis sensor kinase CheA
VTGFDADREAIIETFLGESLEGLASMEEGLVALEARADDPELLATVFRVAHTLKGNAASLGFDALVRFAHTLEDLLDGLRARTVPVTEEVIVLLLQSVDALRDVVPAAVSGNEGLTAAHERLLEQLAARARREESPASAGPADGRSAVPSTAAAAGAGRGLRVDTAKLDRMLDLTGEIAIGRNRLRRLLELSGSTELLEAHGEVDRLSVDLQELVMKSRLVPLRATFRQHLRTVRDLCAASGKHARLLLEGEDVEVDTSVIEHVRDPLTHMVRNAFDHGIEPPHVRAAQGKPPAGTIALRARHEAGTIVIEIEDDGAGLDRERIVERARAAGIDTVRLDDDRLQQLVFEPGFSTAEEVTELSGRGIGLDVVRRNVQALRGTIGLRSRPGQGTVITLRLPLTLAIIDGFAVGVGDETYILPLDTVAECFELPAGASEDGHGGGVLDRRGSALPYLRLSDLLGGTASGRRQHVVVLRPDEGRAAGLVVDELYGDAQTVIKPLGPLFKQLPGIAGSAILPSGRVALILDVPTLIGQACG